MTEHETNKIRAIITGATGMVGEGVLHECLNHPAVEAVLVVGRRSCGISHPKLREIVHPDLYDLSGIAKEMTGYHATFFCLGVSSVGMNESEYYKVTYTLTMHFAETVVQQNPGMVFCYVSGAGTDSSEKGRLKWARVKGKTENDLMKLPFRAAYGFRPSFMLPTPGLKNALSFYKYINWLYPLLRPLFPGYFGTLKELGLSMISVVKNGHPKHILDVKEIRALSERV